MTGLLAALLAADDNDNWDGAWQTFLGLTAIALVIFGIVKIVRGEIVFGIVLIIAACLVGPGGISLFSD